MPNDKVVLTPADHINVRDSVQQLVNQYGATEVEEAVNYILYEQDGAPLAE